MITQLEVTNLSEEEGKISSVGHVFTQGDVPAGQTLTATIDGQQVPLQVDVKATWPDGSIKHAVLTYENPASDSGTAVMELNTGPAQDAPALDILQMAQQQNYDFEVTIDNETIDAVTLLQQDSSNVWLSGPLAAEARVTHTMANGVEVRLDIRAKADGTIETSVTVANDNIDTVSNENIEYSYSISQNGIVVQSDAALTQYHHTVWREKFSTSPENKAVAQYDHDYLRSTNLMLGVDENTPLQDANEHYDELQNAGGSYDPMTGGGIITNRGAGGPSEEYGLRPDAQHSYLVTQSYETRKAMLEEADQFGVFSHYYRNPETDSPFFIEDADAYSNGISTGKDLPGTGGVFVQNNDLAKHSTFSNSHKGSQYYLPYMTTGDRYYADGLAYEGANYLTVGYNHSYLTSDGMVDFQAQIRSQAWDLRDLYCAAQLVPDGTYASQMLNQRLDAALQNYVDYYINGQTQFTNLLGQTFSRGGVDFKDGALEGALYGGLWRPYMQDWFGMVIGQIAASGNEKARALGQWMANYSAGRFLQDDFNPFTHNYSYTALSSDYADNMTWADLEALSTTTVDESQWTTNNRFYVASAIGSMASLFSGTGDARYAEAYLWMVQAITDARLDVFRTDGYHSATQFNSPITFTDGTIASIFHRTIGLATADTISDGAENGLIHAGGGDDSVNTGDGNHLVDGGDGNDTITGGSGEDWLFGGSGEDIIAGGAGTNYLQGDRHDADFGRFADDFVLDGTLGQTTIGDFTAGQDDLIFRNIPELASSADVLSAFVTENGNAVLRLAGGQVLILRGVTAEELTLADITVEDDSGGTEVTLTSGDDVYLDTSGIGLVIHADGGNDHVEGRAGDDTIYGGSGNDTLLGGEGADFLDGGDGIDTARYSDVTLITGEHLIVDLQNSASNTHLAAGDSYVSIENLYGSNFNDTLRGDRAANTLWGANGDDMLIGRGGKDVLFGGADNDRLLGGGGNDVLYGQSGNDVLFGGGGNDRLLGGADNDVLYGQRGKDNLFGGAGNDVLYGQGGKDQLRGDGGDDQLWGGAGADRFEFLTDRENGSDVIIDFTDGVDSISLLGGSPTFEDLTITSAADGDAIITYTGGTIRLDGVGADLLSADDFIFG